MKEISYIVKGEEGIHARPTAKIIKEVAKYKSNVKIIKGEKIAEGTKVMQIVSLGVKKNDEIIIRVEGSDEEEAVVGLKKFFDENI